MRAPRMRVGVYGDSRMSSLPDLLSQVGHDVSYMDYDPTPPAFEELDMVVLEVRDPLLEPAIERLAERARRGQIFIHTSLQHGVQVMDPLEVTGAVVIAMENSARRVGRCRPSMNWATPSRSCCSVSSVRAGCRAPMRSVCVWRRRSRTWRR